MKSDPKMLVLALLLPQLISCNWISERNTQLGFPKPGEQWLSWSAAERSNAVFVYAEGFDAGAMQACSAGAQTDDLSNKELTYRRCRADIKGFSHWTVDASAQPQFRAYADVITDFYSQYPEYRDIPFIYLLLFVNDKEQKTAKELYVMAKAGDIRNHW